MDNRIALVGNPNCGKTTLFNGLTGGRIRTGNWPGVTVEKREGHFVQDDTKITVVDLPGIYSFSASSEDEEVARDYVLSDEPTFILNIVDATNLERNLYLTTQLIEMQVPILVVVNMLDLAEKRGIKIDLDMLSKELGLPVIGACAVSPKDILALKKKMVETSQAPVISDDKVAYPNELEDSVNVLKQKLDSSGINYDVNTRWLAIKLLEEDPWVMKMVVKSGVLSQDEIDAEQKKIESILDDSADIICADSRYGFIHGLTKSVMKKLESRQSRTEKIDKIVLNRVLGIPIFLSVMLMIFWTTITVGGAFIDFFDILFGTVFVDGFGNLLSKLGSPDWLKVILADGLGGGLQTVSTFVPIIFMMFFMLSLLEDSGYMARAAFVMDRFMRYIGLPGKAFVPLLVGFGCTVPAVMATRTLENKRDRLLTIFMAPFMSCGARLPVYALFVAAFFPANGGLIVFAIYLIGIIFSIGTGLLMKNTLFQGEASYFVMELPTYHTPRIKHIMLHTWDRLKGFVIRAGKAILLMVAILSILNSIGTDGSFGNEDSNDSVLSAIGKTITPVFSPMGIEQENWPATVGLFTGIFAKEAIVGTLNSLYSQMDDQKSSVEDVGKEDFKFWQGIGEAFATIPDGLAGVFNAFFDPLGLGVLQEKDEDALAEEIGADRTVFGLMTKFFSKGPHQAFAYLLFVLLYFPCIAAFGAVMKEAGRFLGILNAVYLTLLGWIIATLYYQITIGHSFLFIGIALGIFAFMVGFLYFWGKADSSKV